MKNNIKNGLMAVVLTTCCSLATAQTVADVVKEMRVDWRNGSQETYREVLEKQTAKDLAQRSGPLQKHAPKELLAQPVFWLNGSELYISLDADETGRSLTVAPYRSEEGKVYHLSLQGGLLSVKELKGGTATYEQMGDWRLLIIRDAQKKAIDVFIGTERDDYEGARMDVFRDAHAVYDGHYVTAQGEHAVFGLRPDFYACENDVSDPGLFFLWPMKKDRYTDLLAYGGGRVSHGKPGSGDKPGEGRSGAIMEEMLWRVAPTSDGVRVWVLRDQEEVSHFPAFSRRLMKMAKVAGPYADVPGKWGFASVRPLSTGMLERFPKSALLLMRKEIYARHGDTFKDPEIQAYFDRQPWYKKSGQPVVLTDVERLNNQLIQAVEVTKPDNRLNQISYNYSGMARPLFGDMTLTRDKDNPAKATLSWNGYDGEQKHEVTAVWLDELDAIIKEENMLDYAASYTLNMQVLDGYGWSFRVEYEEDSFSSEGRNAGPENAEGLHKVERYLTEKCSEVSGMSDGE